MKRYKERMWRNLGRVSRLALVLIITPTILTVLPTQAADTKPKIRTEYNRSLNTPNHIIFAAKVKYIDAINADNHENAVQIIRYRMRMRPNEDGSDEEFLKKMLDTAVALRTDIDELTKEMVCNP